MLEKIVDIALVVNKLQAILLMGADFNFRTKLIFGKRMLDQARATGTTPVEEMRGNALARMGHLTRYFNLTSCYVRVS